MANEWEQLAQGIERGVSIGLAMRQQKMQEAQQRQMGSIQQQQLSIQKEEFALRKKEYEGDKLLKLANVMKDPERQYSLLKDYAKKMDIDIGDMPVDKTATAIKDLYSIRTNKNLNVGERREGVSRILKELPTTEQLAAVTPFAEKAMELTPEESLQEKIEEATKLGQVTVSLDIEKAKKLLPLEIQKIKAAQEIKPIMAGDEALRMANSAWKGLQELEKGTEIDRILEGLSPGLRDKLGEKESKTTAGFREFLTNQYNYSIKFVPDAAIHGFKPLDVAAVSKEKSKLPPFDPTTNKGRTSRNSEGKRFISNGIEWKEIEAGAKGEW